MDFVDNAAPVEVATALSTVVHELAELRAAIEQFRQDFDRAVGR